MVEGRFRDRWGLISWQLQNVRASAKRRGQARQDLQARAPRQPHLTSDYSNARDKAVDSGSSHV